MTQGHVIDLLDWNAGSLDLLELNDVTSEFDNCRGAAVGNNLS